MAGQESWTAYYHPDPGVVNLVDIPPHSEANSDLLMDLLMVSAQHVNATQGRESGDVKLQFSINREEVGYLRLLVHTGYIAGCNVLHYPLARFLEQLQNNEAFGRALPGHTLKVAAAGLTEDFYPYYIATSGECATPLNGYLTAGAVRFIAALRLWPAMKGDPKAAMEYIKGMSGGRDPVGLLTSEPFWSSLARGADENRKAKVLSALGDLLKNRVAKEGEELGAFWSRLPRSEVS